MAADEDPGAELTRLTDELVGIQTRINQIHEKLDDAATEVPELKPLQERPAANDVAYTEFAASVHKDHGIS